MEIGAIGVFIVGCGSIGKRHAECLFELGVRKFWFFDTEITQSQLLANKFNGQVVLSYENGLESDCDCVYILSPTSLHIEQATAAVNLSKHVFLEKPLSTSMVGVDELEQLAEKKGVTVFVGFCFRFHEGIKRAKEIIASKRLGKIVSIKAMMGEHFPTVRPDYLSTYYVKYSGAFELVHDLDLAIYFADQELLEYNGFCGSYADLGFESPDTVEMILRFRDCLAGVHLDFFQTPRTRELTILCTGGQLKVEFSTWDTTTVSVYEVNGDKQYNEIIPTERNNMFRSESMAFFNAAIAGEKNPIPISEARKSLEVVCGIYSLD